MTEFPVPGALFADPDNVVGRFLAFTAVPEPATLALLGIGIAALGFSRRARRQ